MRGGLDDALARMARREELRRHAAGSPASPGMALEEVVQAARRAVLRERELSITVSVAYRGRTSEVRVEGRNGEVTITVAPNPSERHREIEPHRDVEHRREIEPSPPAEPSAASQLADLLRRSDPD